AESERFHREIAQLALRLPIDAILPVGDAAIAACRSVATLPDEARFVVLARQEIKAWINSFSTSMVVLVKGSRALELDKLVDELQRA
ncbi:hypothetical protein KAR02_07970, partial [Candidatus Bipolaricaulota bacterium]|nr:hypothetical protein [Candidatus Bipolaricaulota bacterium]